MKKNFCCEGEWYAKMFILKTKIKDYVETGENKALAQSMVFIWSKIMHVLSYYIITSKGVDSNWYYETRNIPGLNHVTGICSDWPEYSQPEQK